MEEQTNTTTTPAAGGQNTPAQGGGDRTFTQDDVNRIVQERLAKEKERGAADLHKRESDLQARELRITAREKLAEQGLPVDLLDALNYTNAEALEKSIALIKGCMQR